jgi:hypothetical protein
MSANDLQPTLIGYFAKLNRKGTDWLKSVLVEEICSASHCMSGCEWDWINEWRHNELWVFDSPALALGVVPEEKRKKIDLYAYWLFSVRFIEGQREAFAIPEVNPVPMDESFENLGFDLVSRSCGNSFECSPLSCNGVAEVVPTNRYCLLDSFKGALALGPTLEAPGQPLRGEPGPYYIIEVWRQRHVSSRYHPALTIPVIPR